VVLTKVSFLTLMHSDFVRKLGNTKWNSSNKT
jgi:hypothetical protein